jgi:hypothetical protein
VVLLHGTLLSLDNSDFYYNIKQEILGIINCIFSFDTARTAQKTAPPTILRCIGNVFTELLPRNDRGIHRQAHRLSFHKTRTSLKMTRPAILLPLHVFVAAGKCLSSRYLPNRRWIHFTERLPSIDRRDTHTDIETDGRDLLSTSLRWAQVA